jgi:hypothetical protein
MSRLTADQLAQFRGCEPWNECYGECFAAAAEAIKERWWPDELAEAEAWAATQTWIP